MRHARSFTFAALAVLAGADQRCSKEGVCSADVQARQSHHALLQVRDKLSVASLDRSEDSDDLVTGAKDHPDLTDWDKDLMTDSSNPLDREAYVAEGSTDGTEGDADSDSAADAKCCQQATVACIACKEHVSEDEYCADHVDTPGCEHLFDCTAGLERWQAGWSVLKMRFCCNKMKVGCKEGNSAGETEEQSAEGAPQGGSSAGEKSTAEDEGFDDDFVTDSTPAGNAGADTASAPTAVKSTAVKSTSGTCVTREDARASTVGYTTSLPGTPFVFGVDDRDEGAHCIMDNGEFGSFGWCWTDLGRTSWGSCSQGCPLIGYDKVLGEMVKDLQDRVDKVVIQMSNTTTATTTVATKATTTAAPNTTTTTKATGGNSTKGEKAGGAKGKDADAKGDDAKGDDAKSAKGGANANGGAKGAKAKGGKSGK